MVYSIMPIFYVRRSCMNLNEIIREIMKFEPLVTRAGGLL